MWKGDQFRPEFTHRAGLPDENDVELGATEKGLRVWLVPCASRMPRGHRRPPAVVLKPGEWIRWQFNYRFGLDDGWFYRLDTMNLAYGAATEDVLLGMPDHFVDERAFLR